MNNEQLKRGQELKYAIDDIHDQISLWEKACSVASIRLNYVDDEYYRTTETPYRGSFSELKESTLRQLKNRLEELEKEYAEL